MSHTTQRDVCSALNMLTPQRVCGRSKLRVGGDGDGGYVMIDMLEPAGGSAYSLGVGPDTSWDVDMATRGWDVFQYDHTVDKAPNFHNRCHFHKIGLASEDLQPHLKRLDTLMARNGHEDSYGHILKIDIEGSEWGVFDSLREGFFARFDQIVAELHWLDHLHDAHFRELYHRVIGNIRRTHTCVHIHANNFAPIDTSTGVSIPPVVEVTLVKTALFDFERNRETSPAPLDFPNNPSRPDIYLGLFSFPWMP